MNKRLLANFTKNDIFTALKHKLLQLLCNLSLVILLVVTYAEPHS